MRTSMCVYFGTWVFHLNIWYFDWSNSCAYISSLVVHLHPNGRSKQDGTVRKVDLQD